MRVRLIHGIHSPEGTNNMAAFAPYLRAAMPGAKIEVFEYGFMGFWAARWDNEGIAKQLAGLSNLQRTGEKEVWVTHSNGAAIAYLATLKYDARPDMIINFNPALDRKKTAPIELVETIHSDSDRAVYASRFLPFHLWGDQGKVGYRGPMQNTLNHNATEMPPGMAYKDHTGAFSAQRINKWAGFVASRINGMLLGERDG